MTATSDEMRPRVALENVGCKLNLYELEALKEGFGRRGYEIVPFTAAADVYVVNTCTVTNSGDSDSRKVVRRARRANPAATVVATGCYAQRRPDDLSAAGAHLVVGNGHKARLLEHLEAHLETGAAASTQRAEQPRTNEFLQIEGPVPLGRTRGTLQIQDGCSEHCTYCIIPGVRGEGVSRPLAEILRQARHMVQAGYRELALTGVHSGSYGQDRGKANALVLLLMELEKIGGLERIRLNSIEPGCVTDALIEYAASSRKFCRHFHIPLQSGDDRVLRRMGRRYKAAEYAAKVEKIAARIPDCAMGADVMVGFPGEREEHFDNTCALIDSLPMTYLHVFPFSLRADTPAERLGDHLSPQVKNRRSRRLIQLGEQKRLDFHRRFLGKELEVLVESRRDKATGLATGMSDNYIKVLLAAPAEAANRILKVRVRSAREDLVFGECDHG